MGCEGYGAGEADDLSVVLRDDESVGNVSLPRVVFDRFRTVLLEVRRLREGGSVQPHDAGTSRVGRVFDPANQRRG